MPIAKPTAFPTTTSSTSRACGSTWPYHTAKGRTLTLGSLKQLEDELPDTFVRVHKSFIVAADRVEALEGNRLHIGEALIPVGGSYRDAVKARLFGG